MERDDSGAEGLRLLLNGEHLLWHPNTQHEARMLAGALFEKHASLRELLLNYVLAGPPDVPEGYEERAEEQVFDVLNHLRSKIKPLPTEAEERWSALSQRGLTADPESPGISVVPPVADVRVPRRVGIASDPPDQTVQRLRGCKDEFEKRGLAEELGAALVTDPEWGDQVLAQIRNQLTKFPSELMSPILWGIRRGIRAASDTTAVPIDELLNVFETMVDRRPDSSLWWSLPSVLEEFVTSFKLTVRRWHSLGMKLGQIFFTFDFDREREQKPVDWLSRAINHPVGRLTELYLSEAIREIQRQKEAGYPYALLKEAQEFFDQTLATVEQGSRYGLCVLGRQLSWLEAVDEGWTTTMLLPHFDWQRSAENAVIAWSGYALSRRLAKGLTEDFDAMYCCTIQHFREFGKTERDGIATHVAATFWFGDWDVEALKRVFSDLDAEGRLKLLSAWHVHLENAEARVASRFFDAYVLPLWAWLCRQDYFGTPNGDPLRFALWRLLPHAHDKFASAAEMAVAYAPSAIEHAYQFPTELLKLSLAEEDGQVFVRLLLAFIKADQNPRRFTRWKDLWDKAQAQDVDSALLEELENELARKGALQSA